MMDSSTYQPIAVNAVSEEKYLGIWCTGSHKPSFQCQRAAAKVMQVLGLIRKLFHLQNVDHFLNILHLYGVRFLPKM